jgi:hypothetical protein
VYAAVFASGNRTTTLHEAAVPDGSLPPPHDDAAGDPAPETGLVVGFNGAHWVDGTGTIWDGQVKFSLPDKDVFVLDAMATPPVETASFSGVGTTLFNMVVNPQRRRLRLEHGFDERSTFRRVRRSRRFHDARARRRIAHHDPRSVGSAPAPQQARTTRR